MTLIGCQSSSPPGDPDLSIELRWLQSYDGERRSDVEIGLLWTLSFLGAHLPQGGPDPLVWRESVVTLRLDRAGVGTEALPHWKRLFALMKASGEYRVNGALDVGRFVAMTLCSSHHYYALTGADNHYAQAYARRAFGSERVAIVESGIAYGERLIEIAKGPTASDIGFVAHEGTGSLSQGTFVTVEHELADIMANGQLRFALYGTDGKLKPAADPALTPAGKPSKCLWCHETYFMRPFKARTNVPGNGSVDVLDQLLVTRMKDLQSARSATDSRVDFERAQQHTYAELLYLTFYEPSAERIAREWDVPVSHVRETLSGLPTHTHGEFDFFERQLYRRSDVDMFAPFSVLEPPTDPREPSEYEPDLLRLPP